MAETNTGPIKIQRLTTADIAVAQTIAELKPGVSAAYVARFLADTNNFLVVALADDVIAGFVLGYKLPRIARHPYMLYIHELEVAPDYQRQGIGTALIDHLRQITEDGQLLPVFLITQTSNEAAVQFYKNTGAHQPYEDDIVFVY